MAAEDNLANLRVSSFSYYLNSGEENFVQKIGTPIEDPLHATISNEISFPSSSGRNISPMSKPSYAVKFSHSMGNPDKFSNHRQVASFSSHLTDAQEKFLLKIKGSVQDPKSELLLPRACPVQLERMKSTNGEIGIFGADKYFNTEKEYGTRMKHDDSNEKLIDLPGLKQNLRSGTSSVNSEASSGKSRSALSQNLPRNTSQTKPKRALGRRIFTSLGCSVPCLDKRAVCITEHRREDPGMMYGSRQISQPEPKRGDHIAFPILNSEMQTQTVKKQLEDKKLEELRKSLDVFDSDTMEKGDIAMTSDRKFSFLTWDAIPKDSSLPTTTVGRTTICDDMASDASSDLFEIENISGSGCPISSMPPADDMSTGCMTPTAQYASEASIEWSVITGSAAEYSSVISDYDEKNIGISGEVTDKSSSSKNLLRKGAPKTRPSGL